MPITEILEENCRKYGEDICLVEINPQQPEDRRITWKEYELMEPTPFVHYRREITWNVFNEKANRFANLLLSRGVKKGDKVAILLMNCLEWLPIYFGILKTGALAVPLNFRYSAEEIEYCVNLSDTDVLVFGPEFIGRVEEIADSIAKNRLLFFVGDGCPSFAESYVQQTANCSGISPDIKLTDQDDAAIYFSSGTTGFPKAILHNHESLMHSCKVAKPKYIMDAISQEKCTIVWLLVPWAQDILDAIDRGDIKLEDYELDQLRLMHIGAQPVPPSLIRRWKEYFPLHQYDTNYGLSESIGPGAVHLGVENIHKVGAIGKAGYGWKTRIVDENGIDVTPGDVGELLLNGPGVMTCYYHDEEATKESLKDGWLYTGDMAQEDEDGFIFLVDRKKDVIISGGENLYPVQIEDFFRAHKASKDIAVIGLPDKRLGEIAAAVVEIKEGAECTQEELEQFCKKLPRYKRPHKYIFAEVPRNATGKIEKPKLREIYCGKRLVEMQNKG